jgi:cytochrome c oxidase cbb3-type subunit 2
MPPYPWFKEKKVNVKETLARMDALGFPYTEEEAAELEGATQLDAMVAYMQVLGTSIAKEAVITVDYADIEEMSPLEGNADAIATGQALYKAECAGCHGQNAEGNIGASLVDYAGYGNADNDTYITIANGYEGAMPGYASKFSKEKIWSIVEYIKSLNK